MLNLIEAEALEAFPAKRRKYPTSVGFYFKKRHNNIKAPISVKMIFKPVKISVTELDYLLSKFMH
jgi:hypothetical protein